MRIDRAFAMSLLETARAKGADYAEVYLKSAKDLTAEAKGREMDAVESSVDLGYSLRIIRDQRLGFAYSTDMNEIDAVVSNAVEASKWTEQDEYLYLPEDSSESDVDILDEAVASISEEDAMANALIIEKAALDADKRITKVRKASASFSHKEVIVVNSKGLDKSYSATACTAQITVVAEDGNDSQMGWDFNGSRFLSDISFKDVGRNAAKRALQLLGAQKMKAVKAQVLMDSSVAAEFLGIFASLLSSENVQKGKSLLANRRGQKVVNHIVSITDSGLMPHRLGSRPFDDEGVATSGKYLIKDGLLLDYMYNTYTARKGGVKSTGNAVKAGFSALPAVGPSNFFITPSAKRAGSDLLGMVDKGIYVTEAMGVHTANPVSGEFSIGISGLWTENGLIRYPVKEAIISGNILDFFSKAEAVGDDLIFYGNIGSPSLLIGLTDISA